MRNFFKVKLLMMTSGERLPILLDTRTGMPLFEPTVYALTNLRGRNRSANTIKSVLRSIMLFQIFQDKYEIDLKSRLAESKILDMNEIELLAQTCKLQLSEIDTDFKSGKSKPFDLRNRERVRRIVPRTTSKTIDIASASNRMRTIVGYLSWLINSRLLKLPVNSSAFKTLESAEKSVINLLRARIPNGSSKSELDARVGLAPESVATLFEVIDANSSKNPWNSLFCRARNELLVRWFFAFGLRRGEILNVKISDINFRTEELTIVRRSDAKDDPRFEQPMVKTRDRILSMPPDICRLTHAHILNCRNKIRGAKAHNYLFVADKSGAPMSLSAVNKCFSTLRSKFPDLPNELCPHVLRHTWNDHFSEVMDSLGTPEPDEQKYRSHCMGWSETSGTASTYTRRHIRKRANEISLGMQLAILEKVKS